MEDFKKIVQDANGYLRTAQNCMFSGKNSEAVELLNKADDLGEKAKQQMPNDFQVTSILQKVEKMRKDLERKGVAARPGGNIGLPFEVESALGSIRGYIVKKDAAGARSEMDGFYARFAGPLTAIPEIQELNESLRKLETEVAAVAKQQAEEEKENAQAKQQLKELCWDWELKLKKIPYFDGTPHNVPQLLEEKETFQKAQNLFSEYEQVHFTGQKAISLESLERDIRQRMEMFAQNFAQTAAYLTNGIAESIERRMENLNRDTAWINDPSQMPSIIGKNDISGFATQIEEVKPLFEGDPSGVDSAASALGKLQEMDSQRRIERSKRTTMKPEALSGPDAEAAKTTAIQTLLANYPQATVLKAAVVKPWEAKRIEDWADSTRTQWITRNFNETTVQIAALLPDENCRLFTLHFEKSLQFDGTYGSPKSHIMFDERMAKENIE